MENEKLKRYNIYYSKYNIMARGYISYIRTIMTTDVYHEIGKMICSSLEHIKRISYTEPKATHEECERMWKDYGFRKLDNNLWVSEEVDYD